MILKLSNQVINKIAAGEVVQRPYNALKQLIQNSIDAGANVIHIKLQNGGLKKLQIKDNGKGISIQDYPLLCQRYATSKIKTVTDLQSIQSFGFRGQALASLTHVGQVEVVSRHQSSRQGYYARFQNQKLIGQPKQVKREIGTTIIVQNLFSTLSSRRKSLTPNEEKKMIKELIFQMALDNPHIEFTLSTQKGQQLLIDQKYYSQQQARVRIFCQLTGVIRQNCVYASQTIKGTKITAIFSKINTWDKWRNVILTINHRIIDSPQLQKIVQKAYDQANRTIHKQNYSYCVYLNISIDPKKIDCNIHPSKKQVSFYKSTEFFFEMLKWMSSLLQQSGTVKFLDTECRISQHSLMQMQSRYHQKVLYPTQFIQQANKNSNINNIEKNQSQQQGIKMSQNISNSQTQQKVQYAFNKTRTDSKQLPIQYFYKNLIQGSSSNEQIKKYFSNNNINENPQYFGFKSFLDYHQLEESLKRQIHQFKQFFQSVTYVGCFNSSHIFIQLGNKLYCFNIQLFVKVYARELLKQKRSLYIKRLNSESRMAQKVQISSMLEKFLLKNSHMMERQKMQRIYNTTMQQLKFNRDYLHDKYGIKINQLMQLQSYPIVDKAFETQPLRQEPLIYFLIQLFASNQLENKQDLNKLYMQFLSGPFYISQENEQQKYKISPFVDRYDSFFSNQLIPTMKMKARFYQDQFDDINLPDLLSEMMDLKDAYKMFQRC